jgi:hypothetical protein
MPAKGYQWVSTPDSGAAFKAAKPVIERECQRIIDEVFKPRLGQVTPVAMYNYPVDVFGSWNGKNFRFIQKYRTGTLVTPMQEFDTAFTRLEYVGADNYNHPFFRHTGKWNLVDAGLSLNAALKQIREEEVLQPYF